MSLRFSLFKTKHVPAHDEQEELFDRNITHNLAKMAKDAGIYECLWRPEDLGIKKARELVDRLSEGLDLLRSDPKRFEAFDSPNGWGTYKHFVPFVEDCLRACIENPEAQVESSR